MSSKSLNKDMILYQIFTIKVALQIYVNHMLLLKVTMNSYPISMHKPKVEAEGQKKIVPSKMRLLQSVTGY